MLKLERSIVSRLVSRFRSRAVVELENLALRQPAARSSPPAAGSTPAVRRLLWVLLYRLWPRCLEAMVLVKPATVIQWHRQGFRLFWRWRSRSGRPSVEREIRDLIRQMSSANPLWGAPRIHGELLKLGIEVSQATCRKSRRHPKSRWPASSLRTSGRLIRPGFLLTNRCAAARTPSSEDLCIGGNARRNRPAYSDGRRSSLPAAASSARAPALK